MIRFTDNSSNYYLCDAITAGRIWRKLQRDYMPYYCDDPIFVKGRVYAIEVDSEHRLYVINGAYFVENYAHDVHMM